MYHQPLELKDFLIVKVDFGCGRYIECLSIDATDNTEVINVPERTFHQYAIAESKKPLVPFQPNFRMRSAVSVLE